jgi:hypothetical protein
MHHPAGTSTGVASGNNAGPAGTTGTATPRRRLRRCPLTSVAIRRAATRKSGIDSSRSVPKTAATSHARRCLARPISCLTSHRRTSKAGRCSGPSHGLRRCMRHRRCHRHSRVLGRIRSHPRRGRPAGQPHRHRTHRPIRQRARTAATLRVVLKPPTHFSRRRVTVLCPIVRRRTSRAGRYSGWSHGPNRRKRQGRSHLHSHAVSRMHSNPRGSRTDRKQHSHRTRRAKWRRSRTAANPRVAIKLPTEDRTGRGDGKGRQGLDNDDERRCTSRARCYRT